MKAIIPVAGAGTRLRPHTYTQPKALIPVAGKPILAHIIDQLSDAGIDEFIFIIGYLGEKVRQFIEEKYPDLKVHFVVQENRSGVGHAIWAARDLFEPEEDMFISLGDTIVDVDLRDMFEFPHSVVGVKKVQDPRTFGVAVMNSGDVIMNLVEKPEIPKSNMALVGIYLIRKCGQLLKVLDQMVKDDDRSHGEIQLTDALMELIENGEHIMGFRVNGWYDMGKIDVLLETNAILLKKIGDLAKADWEQENTIIIEPVSVSEGAEIRNSIIGPNVTIGEHTKIDSAIVRNSIIGSYASIRDVTLMHSLIGNDTSVVGSSHCLNIGDNTDLDLSGRKS